MAGELILIADDDELVRRALAIDVRDAGFRTLEADGGHKALALARSERPHLMMLDILMPDLSGLATLGVIRADPLTRHTPVIMLTSQRQRSDVLRARDLNVADYVVKPIDKRTLVSRVLRALNAHGRDQSSVEWLD